MQGRSGWGRRSAGAAVVLAMAVQVVSTRDGAAQTRPAVDDGVQELAQRAAAGAWDIFSARVIVRRQWVTASGSPAGLAMGDHEYIWERERTATGWTSRVTVVAGPPPTVGTPQGEVALAGGAGDPDAAGFIVARIEDSEDGSAPRFFSPAGVELRPSWRPSATTGGGGADVPAGAIAGIDPVLVEQAAGFGPGRRPTGRDWIDRFVMQPGRASMRLRSVTKAFGRRAGWVRGHGQYLRSTGARRLELLVDEQDGVPVEVNVTDAGTLQSHTRFRYERAGSGALVRRGVRVERPAPPALSGATSAGARVVTDITYSQVRLLSKGGR